MSGIHRSCFSEKAAGGIFAAFLLLLIIQLILTAFSGTASCEEVLRNSPDHSDANDAIPDSLYVSDGSYLSCNIPVDVYCDRTVYRIDEPFSICVDILGGTPPFNLEWFLIAYSEEMNEYLESHPEFQTDYSYLTYDRHSEMIFSLPVDCGSVKFSVFLTDAEGETSENQFLNDTGDFVKLYSPSEWLSQFPGREAPAREHFPFWAETISESTGLRYGCDEYDDPFDYIQGRGSLVEVIGKDFDDGGNKWYIVRKDFYSKGYVPGEELIYIRSSEDTSTPVYSSAGRLSSRWFPSDIYSSAKIYHANERITFTADILGGTPPFDVCWSVQEFPGGGKTPLDEFLESRPDYPMHEKYSTDSRHIMYVYTPPVESEGFIVSLEVSDSNGVRNYRWNEDGNRPPAVRIYASSEVNKSDPAVFNSCQGHFPFMSATRRDNVLIVESYGKKTLIPDRGTPVRVIGMLDDGSPDGIRFIIRLDFKTFGTVPAESIQIPAFPSEN